MGLSGLLSLVSWPCLLRVLQPQSMARPTFEELRLLAVTVCFHLERVMHFAFGLSSLVRRSAVEQTAISAGNKLRFIDSASERRNEVEESGCVAPLRPCPAALPETAAPAPLPVGLKRPKFEPTEQAKVIPTDQDFDARHNCCACPRVAY